MTKTMHVSSNTTPTVPPALLEQVRIRDTIAAMSPAERTTRCARVVFRAQVERAPTDAELRTFLTSGDYHRALEDPVTFERLEGQATKAGRPVLAATWAAIARLASGAPSFDPVPFAILQTILIHERDN